MAFIIRSTALALLVAFSGLAFAAEHDDALDIEFPDVIGSLRFMQKTVFPQQGLGVGYAYQHPRSRITASIYVYTAGLSAIPSGIDSPEVRQNFDEALRDIKAMETLGRAKSVTASTPATQATSAEGCGPQLLSRSFVIDFGDAMPAQSHAYITAMNNNFVKLRITARVRTAQDQRDVEDFVAELRRVLGHCA